MTTYLAQRLSKKRKRGKKSTPLAFDTGASTVYNMTCMIDADMNEKTHTTKGDFVMYSHEDLNQEGCLENGISYDDDIDAYSISSDLSFDDSLTMTGDFKCAIESDDDDALMSVATNESAVQITCLSEMEEYNQDISSHSMCVYPSELNESNIISMREESCKKVKTASASEFIQSGSKIPGIEVKIRKKKKYSEPENMFGSGNEVRFSSLRSFDKSDMDRICYGFTPKKEI